MSKTYLIFSEMDHHFEGESELCNALYCILTEIISSSIGHFIIIPIIVYIHTNVFLHQCMPHVHKIVYN